MVLEIEQFPQKKNKIKIELAPFFRNVPFDVDEFQNFIISVKIQNSNIFPMCLKIDSFWEEQTYYFN